MKTIDPKRIIRNETIHGRVRMDDAVVADYVEAMKRGDEFPPVLLFWNGKSDRYLLVDGFHRLAAWEQINPKAFIPAQIKLGSEETARWVALGVNKKHGLRRTNADKRRVVELALQHPKGQRLSNLRIARHLGVSEFLVRSIRKELEKAEILFPTTLRETDGGYPIQTAKIGGDQSCPQCDLLRNGRCLFRGDFPEQLDLGCVEFRPKKAAPETKIVSLENLNLLPNAEMSETVHLHTNCKSGAVSIPLYKDSPTLSAIELRHRLGDEWLSELYMAIPSLLKEKTERKEDD